MESLGRLTGLDNIMQQRRGKGPGTVSEIDNGILRGPQSMKPTILPWGLGAQCEGRRNVHTKHEWNLACSCPRAPGSFLIGSGDDS